MSNLLQVKTPIFLQSQDDYANNPQQFCTDYATQNRDSCLLSMNLTLEEKTTDEILGCLPCFLSENDFQSMFEGMSPDGQEAPAYEDFCGLGTDCGTLLFSEGGMGPEEGMGDMPGPGDMEMGEDDIMQRLREEDMGEEEMEMAEDMDYFVNFCATNSSTEDNFNTCADDINLTLDNLGVGVMDEIKQCLPCFLSENDMESMTGQSYASLCRVGPCDDLLNNGLDMPPSEEINDMDEGMNTGRDRTEEEMEGDMEDPNPMAEAPDILMMSPRELDSGKLGEMITYFTASPQTEEVRRILEPYFVTEEQYPKCDDVHPLKNMEFLEEEMKMMSCKDLADMIASDAEMPDDEDATVFASGRSQNEIVYDAFNNSPFISEMLEQLPLGSFDDVPQVAREQVHAYAADRIVAQCMHFCGSGSQLFR